MDVLVSEPMGTLLVNERMIESYIYARDKFLKPGGACVYRCRLYRCWLCTFAGCAAGAALPAGAVLPHCPLPLSLCPPHPPPTPTLTLHQLPTRPPAGKMFPRLGRVHLCAFSDEQLYGEVAQKADFFRTPDFYGVDVTSLHRHAAAGYFGQVGRGGPRPRPDDGLPACLTACLPG